VCFGLSPSLHAEKAKGPVMMSQLRGIQKPKLTGNPDSRAALAEKLGRCWGAVGATENSRRANLRTVRSCNVILPWIECNFDQMNVVCVVSCVMCDPNQCLCESQSNGIMICVRSC
jgi:hypothetical protein